MRRASTLILIAACLQCAPAGCEEKGDRFHELSSEWERNEKDILWGFRNMYNPHVIHEPGALYPFRMWFFGWCVEDCNPGYEGCDAIYHARSRDLEHWEVYSGPGMWDAGMNADRWVPVVFPVPSYFDAWHNGDPSVVRRGDRYYMAYSSYAFDRDMKPSWDEGDIDGDLCCILGAVSDDGITWEHSEAPILVWKPEIGVKEDLQGSDYYGLYHRPSILYEDGHWRMWFDYLVEGQVCMGYAECHGDFMEPSDWNVVRAGAEPLIHEWPNPDIVKYGGRYYSFADPGGYGEGWPGRQIAIAESRDGLDWTILGYLEPDSDTPANQIPEGFVLDTENGPELCLFYACQIGGEPYDYRYNRIRIMRMARPTAVGSASLFGGWPSPAEGE